MECREEIRRKGQLQSEVGEKNNREARCKRGDKKKNTEKEAGKEDEKNWKSNG